MARSRSAVTIRGHDPRSRSAVTIRGRTYPVHSCLGCGVYPESWRRMYGVLAVRE